MKLKKFENIEFVDGGVCAAKGRLTEYSADLLMQAHLLQRRKMTSL